MALDFEKMSREELVAIISDAQKALKTVDARRKLEAKRAAEKAVKEFGFSLDDVLAAGGKGPKGSPKYVNPSDSSQTWTGRGRKPNWVIEALNAGKDIEEMAI